MRLNISNSFREELSGNVCLRDVYGKNKIQYFSVIIDEASITRLAIIFRVID